MQLSNNAPTTMPPEASNDSPEGKFVAEDPLDRCKCWLLEDQVMISFPDFPGKRMMLESEHLHRLLSALAPFEGMKMRVIPPDVLLRHRVRAPFGIAFMSDTAPTIVYVATALSKTMARRFFKGFALVAVLVGTRGTAGNGNMLKHVHRDPSRN